MSSIIEDKTLAFSKRMVDLQKHLKYKKREYVISDQVFRSGTSIGANVVEAENGESRLDFRHKLCIALKEASETIYWLKLLRYGEYITDVQYRSLKGDAEEIKRILISIIKSLNNGS